MTTATRVPQLLDGRRICICVGAGGVGKTTTSAAIAVGMAARGLKVAVVTIDPARRLANALGLEQLDNEPRLIDPERLQGVEMKGQLWAMMLDPKRTFDELIDRLAPTPERAEEIKRNRVYRERLRAAGGEEVLFKLPSEIVALLDDLKERQGLRNRSQALLQLIGEKGATAQQMT